MVVMFQLASAAAARPCALTKVAHGNVCACNATYCDDIPAIGWTAGNYVVFQSAKRGDRLVRTSATISSQPSPAQPDRTITVDPTSVHQTLKGFGNAITDAAALNFKSMSKGVQDQLVTQYWGSGLNLSISRVPIASTDFSTHVYSYDDVDDDTALAHFSVEMDEEAKLPLLRRAMALSPGMKLFASVWAPPAWMTTTHKTTGNPSLAGGPTGPIAHTYAKYLVRFFEEYAAKGIQFWGLTAQNEPAGNTGAWQDLKFSPEEQRDFIREALGPALNTSASTRGLALMVMDDQRIHLPGWVTTVLADPEAAKYVAGVGFHWYAAVDDSTPSALYFGKVAKTAELHPEVFLFATEACEGSLPWSKGPRIGDWTRGETYAHDVLGDINSGAVGWTDWNAFLDLSGGPNWAKNVVDSPILLDTKGGSTFFKNPMWYGLAHFTNFLPPGTRRVGVESTSSSVLHAAMECGAFLTPEGRVVVVVLNRAAAKTGGAQLSDTTAFSVRIKGWAGADGVDDAWINLKVPAHSMATIVV